MTNSVFFAIFGVALWTFIAVGTLLSMFIEMSKRARRMNERLQRLEDRVSLDLEHLRELHEHAVERSESFAQQLIRDAERHQSRRGIALDDFPLGMNVERFERMREAASEKANETPRVSAWKRLRGVE